MGKEWTVEKDHVGPRIENIEHVNKTVENMVQLDEVHPATVSHNLMVRFVDQNEFMTRVGPILVVINPFKFYPKNMAQMWLISTTTMTQMACNRRMCTKLLNGL